MSRYAFLAAIGLLATTAPLSAQTAKDAPPASAAVESPNSADAMEEAQLGDHWTYELKDEIAGEVKGHLHQRRDRREWNGNWYARRHDR
jgi:hypothetical protein